MTTPTTEAGTRAYSRTRFLVRFAWMPVARAIALVVLFLITAQALLLLAGGNPALAQDINSGSADNIISAGEKLFEFICRLVVIGAVIGIVVSAALWATAFGNEKRKAMGQVGVVCAVGAFIVALLAPDFLALGEDVTGNSFN